jgi:hypothetical protein
LRTRANRTSSFNAYALFLALLIFTAFGGKELHILLEHSHSAVEICDAKAGDVHLHDYDNLEHGCDLCDFAFSHFTFSLPQFSVFKKNLVAPVTNFVYFHNGLFLHPSFVALRGPPVAA